MPGERSPGIFSFWRQPAGRNRPICATISTNPPGGQIAPDTVKPLAQKYSGFPK
jgi:hypothetical protein